MNPELILQFLAAALQALPTVIATVDQAKAEIEALAAQLRLFQTQNRDPTAAEWADLNARLSAALDGLMNARPGG